MAQWPNHPYYPPPPPYYPPPPQPYYPPPPPANCPTYPTTQPQPGGNCYPHQQHHHATPLHSPATCPTYPTTQPHEQQPAGNYYPHQQPPATYPAGNHYPQQHHGAPYYPAPYYNPPPPVYMGRPVVGPQYCIGYAVDLVTVRKFWTLTDDFVVRDVNKNVLFKAKGKLLTLHDNRLLSDASGKPVITLRQKIMTMHSRWEVYRGNSSEDRDLIFTAKTSSMVQFKTKLNVYLAHNKSEEVCDYRVKGSFTKGSCVVYVGDSKTNIAAQMKTKDSLQSEILGKDKFMVTVSPNVDHAFVVGLILILDAIKNATDVVDMIVQSIVG